jgi:hypothetical protein
MNASRTALASCLYWLIHPIGCEVPHAVVAHFRERNWRDATTPPGMCSGFVDTLREPQAEHRMRRPISGTGVEPGNGSVVGSMSRSRAQSRHQAHSNLLTDQIAQ